MKIHNGIYVQFSFPDDISDLNIETIKTTLSHLQFIAEMSDSWKITQTELKRINDYKNKHPELRQ